MTSSGSSHSQLDAPDGRDRTSLAEITALIEANDGPGGLHLAERDLSDLDLSGAAAFRLARARRTALPVIWLASRFGRPALNLIGVVLRDAHLVRADLGHARLQLADLRGADLYAADLVATDMYRADAEGASFYRADLRRAKLERAQLVGCDLRAARLDGANLLRTNLDGALLHRASLGGRLLQEDAALYKHYVLDDRRIRDFSLSRSHQPGRDRAHLYPLFAAGWTREHDEIAISSVHLRQRYVEASEIYRSLQACFASQGRHDEASWAHVQARRMQRKSWFPTHARHCYPADWTRSASRVPGIGRALAGLIFLCRWARDLLYAACSGYGERPARPLGLLVAFVIVCAAWYNCAGVVSPGHTPSPRESVVLSVASLVSMGFSDLSPADTATKLVSSAEAAVGLSLFALLMFTLGNRMART